ITPKIIRQYEGIRTVLDRKLKERDDFLEKSVGNVAIGKDFRDNIIRSLPDLKKVQSEKPQTNFTIDSSSDGGNLMLNDAPAGYGTPSSPSNDMSAAPTQA